jgi:hypothetical protein
MNETKNSRYCLKQRREFFFTLIYFYFLPVLLYTLNIIGYSLLVVGLFR